MSASPRGTRNRAGGSRRATRWAWLLLVVLLAAACASPEVGESLADQIPSDGRTTAMADTDLTEDITFGHQGEGIPGGAQTLVVSPDGTAVLTTGQATILEPVTFDVADDHWGTLMAALETADLANQPEYTVPGPEDEFGYDVLFTFEHGEASVTVTFQDAPDELVSLAEAFQDVIAIAPEHPRRD